MLGLGFCVVIGAQMAAEHAQIAIRKTPMRFHCAACDDDAATLSEDPRAICELDLPWSLRLGIEGLQRPAEVLQLGAELVVGLGRKLGRLRQPGAVEQRPDVLLDHDGEDAEVEIRPL